MRISTALFALVTASVFAIGCEDEKKPLPVPPTTIVPPSAQASGQPSASASASAVTATVAPNGKMAHCPSAVTGATTVITDVDGGVELVVTSKDAAGVADIRARAKVLADASKSPAAAAKHNGGGGGGGTFGRCPVVMKDTTVDLADVPDGTKITVKTKNAETLPWLRRETRERYQDVVPQATQGAGERKMAHCPSAVDGAQTQVKDTKDGVTITVTAKGDVFEKDIRSRAKFVVEASLHDAGAVTHSGSGTGGGGLGRCPVVVKDTTVGAKDVPGGSELVVKSKKPGDVANLQKEVRERALNFRASQTGATPGASASAAPSASASAAPKK